LVKQRQQQTRSCSRSHPMAEEESTIMASDGADHVIANFRISTTGQSSSMGKGKYDDQDGVFSMALEYGMTSQEVALFWELEWGVHYASKIKFEAPLGAPSKTLGRGDAVPTDPAVVRLRCSNGSVLASLATAFRQRGLEIASDDPATQPADPIAEQHREWNEKQREIAELLKQRRHEQEGLNEDEVAEAARRREEDNAESERRLREKRIRNYSNLTKEAEEMNRIEEEEARRLKVKELKRLEEEELRRVEARRLEEEQRAAAREEEARALRAEEARRKEEDRAARWERELETGEGTIEEREQQYKKRQDMIAKRQERLEANRLRMQKQAD